MSIEGGWSLDVPAAWIVKGDGGALRGGEIYSFDPTGAQLSGNVPPAGGVRVSVRLQPNLHGRDPLDYATKEPSASAGATVTERQSLALGGGAAALVVGRAYSPAPFDLVHAWWFVRPPLAPDRMLVIDAWPIDGATRPQVERITSTLRLSSLPSVPTVPTITRAQAERCFIPSQVRRTDRVATKLILWRDYELALERVRPNGPRPWGGEPDQLVWAVLVVGDIAPSGKGAPPLLSGTAPPPVSPRHLVLFVDAMRGTGGSGPQDGGLEEQPTWWEEVRDRAP